MKTAIDVERTHCHRIGTVLLSDGAQSRLAKRRTTYVIIPEPN
jgi:hypothetical protein